LLLETLGRLVLQSCGRIQETLLCSQGPECLPVQPQLSQSDPLVVLNVGHPLMGFPDQGSVDLQCVVGSSVGSTVGTIVPVFAPACVRIRVRTLVVPCLIRQSGSPRHGQPRVVPSLHQRQRSVNNPKLVPPLPPINLLLLVLASIVVYAAVNGVASQLSLLLLLYSCSFLFGSIGARVVPFCCYCWRAR